MFICRCIANIEK
jgi:hypothetical protein